MTNLIETRELLVTLPNTTGESADVIAAELERITRYELGTRGATVEHYIPGTFNGETADEIAATLRDAHDHVYREDDYVDTGDLIEYTARLEATLRDVVGIDIEAVR